MVDQKYPSRWMRIVFITFFFVNLVLGSPLMTSSDCNLQWHELRLSFCAWHLIPRAFTSSSRERISATRQAHNSSRHTPTIVLWTICPRGLLGASPQSFLCNPLECVARVCRQKYTHHFYFCERAHDSLFHKKEGDHQSR